MTVLNTRATDVGVPLTDPAGTDVAVPQALPLVAYRVDAEEAVPAVNPWLPPALLYGLPLLLITATALAVTGR